MAYPVRLSALAVLVVSSIALPAGPAVAGEYQSPIVLESTTTIYPESNPIFDMATDTPADFILEIIPAGGTLRLRLDGDIVATWNDEDVVPGTSFNMYARLDTNSASVGEVAVEYSYLLRPGFRINWESLFRDSTYWDREDSTLLDFPDTGTVVGKFPLTGMVPEVSFRREVGIPLTDSVFLLAGALMSATAWEDTQHVSYDHWPFPCVHLHAAATIRTSLRFDIGTDSLCIRYAPPGDTLCWEADDGDTCQFQRQPPWEFQVWVPCGEVCDLVVPFCPVRAGCWAQVDIATEVVLDTLELSYETVSGAGCSLKTTLIEAAPDTMTSPWLSQYLEFGTDRDDAIFTVPVPLKHVDVDLLDAAGDPLPPLETISAYDSCRIAWVSIDDALAYCCDPENPSYSALISYRDVVQDTVSCWDHIIDGVPSDSLGYSWTVPDIECLAVGDTFRVYIDFYCPQTDTVLYRAWSDLFLYGD